MIKTTPNQKMVIASLFKYGQTISQLATNYKLSERDVEEVIRRYLKSIDRAKRDENKLK